MRRVPAAMLVMCCVFAAVAIAAPKIHVEETRYDFGTVQEGFVVTHTFLIENVGDEVLEIINTRVSCGCTTAALATNELAPGESVALDVRLNTSGFGGHSVNKTIYVYSNDPEYGDSFGSDLPLFILRITGDVVKLEAYQITASDLDYLAYVLIDLRPSDAYASGHLQGAISIPAPSLADSLDQFPSDAWLILYDQDGQTVAQVADGLQAYGYASVWYLHGGLDEWISQYDRLFLDPVPETVGDRSDASCSGHCLRPDVMRSALYLVIDLRSAEEYAAGHLVGAFNVAPAAVGQFLIGVPADTQIVLYDQNGESSDIVAQQLYTGGFARARSLLGGLGEWARQFGDRYIIDGE